MKKNILIVTAALAISLGISGTALAAGWQQMKPDDGTRGMTKPIR